MNLHRKVDQGTRTYVCNSFTYRFLLSIKGDFFLSFPGLSEINFFFSSPATDNTIMNFWTKIHVISTVVEEKIIHASIQYRLIF